MNLPLGVVEPAHDVDTDRFSDGFTDEADMTQDWYSLMGLLVYCIALLMICAIGFFAILWIHSSTIVTG